VKVLGDKEIWKFGNLSLFQDAIMLVREAWAAVKHSYVKG